MSKKKKEVIKDERKAIDDYIKKHGVKKCKGHELEEGQTFSVRQDTNEIYN